MPLKLPTKKIRTGTPLGKTNIILYAPPKFGKTTFASHFPNTLFLATEPGLNEIECFKLDIQTWDQMREAYKLLAEGNHEYQTVVVDTIDNGFQFCAKDACDAYNVIHENEVPFGAATGRLNTNFFRFLMMLTQLPYTIILISHEKQKEVTVNGNKILKSTPSLSTKNAEKVTGLVDVILYGQLVPDTKTDDGFKRIIHTRPCSWHEAGDRTGYLPDRLPLDGHAFIKAYTEGYNKAMGLNKKPEENKK